MTRALLVVLLAASTLGCPKAQGPASADAAVASSSERLDAGWALTAPVLDAWLRYHQQLRSGGSPLRSDGGALSDDVRRRARFEATARADAGLSEEDVDRVEEVVAAVVAERAIARISGQEAVAGIEKALAELKDEQRAQAEKALSDVKEKQRRAGTLAAERARFGEATVDAVLTREAEVTKTWEALMDARGDKQ